MGQDHLPVAEGNDLMRRALAEFAPEWELTTMAHLGGGAGEWIYYRGMCQFRASITNSKSKFEKVFGRADSDPPGQLTTQPYSCHPAIPCTRLVAYRDSDSEPIRKFIEVEILDLGERAQG
jgi:hypothetical protein